MDMSPAYKGDPDYIDWTAYGRASGGYAKREYVEDYLERRVFPRIHNEMETAARNFGGDLGACLDLGASTGLLAMRFRRNLGVPRVIGLEPSAGDVRVFNHLLRPDDGSVNVHQFALDVLDDKSREEFVGLCQTHGVKTLLARRVVPEVLTKHIDKGTNTVKPAAAKALPRLLAEAGIKTIIVQGRIYSARSAHPVAKLATEVAILETQYTVRHRAGDVAVMTRN